MILGLSPPRDNRVHHGRGCADVVSGIAKLTQTLVPQGLGDAGILSQNLIQRPILGEREATSGINLIVRLLPTKMRRKAHHDRFCDN